MKKKIRKKQVALNKRICLFIFFNLFVLKNTLIAQNFEWATSVGGSYISGTVNEGKAIAVDGNGNVYSTGLFAGTVDFDPGTSEYKMTSLGSAGLTSDIFILKVDSTGNFLWAKQLGIQGNNEDALTIKVDGLNNVIVGGWFNGTMDFDPNAGIYNITSSSNNGYLLKLNSSGNFIWAKTFGSQINSIDIDAADNIYSTGSFSGTNRDFDPGSGVYNISSQGSKDIFISKINTSGSFIWAYGLGQSSGDDNGISINISNNSNIYLLGTFKNTIDIDPSATVFNLVNANSQSTFILKLDLNANFIWAKQIDKVTNPSEIITDAVGNSYITGAFNGTIDFDPSININNLISASNDAFLLKLDANGLYVWAKNFGDDGTSLAFDLVGNIITVGTFNTTNDFDPGSGVFTLTNSGSSDGFISLINSSGIFISAYKIGNAGNDLVDKISVDNQGNILIIGTFVGTEDFNPGAGINNLSSTLSTQNTYILKLNSSQSFKWAKNIGGTRLVKTVSQTTSVINDGNGNVYAVGYFSGNVDFDPTVNNFILSSNGTNSDIFITKTDPTGHLVWAKSIGGSGVDDAVAFTIDGTSNLYIAGNYSNTVDFNPGSGTFNLTGSDYLLKLDLNGNFIWAQNSVFNANKMKVDNSGNIIISGSFNASNLDFDPGAGTFLLSSSGGSNDVCVSKLNSSGTFLWAVKMGGTNTDKPNSMDLDATGNIYLTGIYKGTADFDPGSGTFNLVSISSSQDAFVCKLDVNGVFGWAYSIGQTTGDDQGISIDISSNNFLYLTGNFKNTIDVNSSSSTFNLTNSSSASSFITKWDLNANFVWAKQLDNVTDVRKISTDLNDNIYLTGNFSGTKDFDLGTNTYNLTSVGSTDIFIVKMDNLGSFIWAKITGGTNNEMVIDAEVYGNGITYLVGSFTSTIVDFNPGIGTSNISLIGSQDGFLQKLSPDGIVIVPQININASQTTICPSTTQVTYTATALTGNPNETYQWKKNGVNVGTNSTQYINTTPLSGDQVNCILTSSGFTVTSNTITINSSTVVSPSVTLTTSQSSICPETNEVDYYANSSNGGAAPTFAWYKNGILLSNNTSIFTDTLMSVGDQVSVRLTSNASCVSPSTATSQVITLTNASSNLQPIISISASQNSICSSTSSIVYSCVSFNAGSAPVYQWYKNKLPVGISDPVYIDNNPSANDTIYCVLKSNATCTNSQIVTSNILNLSLTSTVKPTISIVASQSTICNSSSQVVFNAISSNTGTNPSFQWYKNGASTGTNNPSFVLNSPIANDVIYCVMTSNASCANPITASSNTITLSFSNVVTPTLSISSLPGITCSTTAASFSLNSTNGGQNPQYSWKKNGSPIGGNFAIYNDTLILLNDTITVTMISDASCIGNNASVTANFVMSNILTWTGAIDSDWHKPCNWFPNLVPSQCNSVVIPFTTNQPVVSAVAACHDISIYTTNGATLTVNNGANLQIETCPVAATMNTCP